MRGSCAKTEGPSRSGAEAARGRRAAGKGAGQTHLCGSGHLRRRASPEPRAAARSGGRNAGDRLQPVARRSAAPGERQSGSRARTLKEPNGGLDPRQAGTEAGCRRRGAARRGPARRPRQHDDWAGLGGRGAKWWRRGPAGWGGVGSQLEPKEPRAAMGETQRERTAPRAAPKYVYMYAPYGGRSQPRLVYRQKPTEEAVQPYFLG